MQQRYRYEPLLTQVIGKHPFIMVIGDKKGGHGAGGDGGDDDDDDDADEMDNGGHDDEDDEK